MPPIDRDKPADSLNEFQSFVCSVVARSLYQELRWHARLGLKPDAIAKMAQRFFADRENRGSATLDELKERLSRFVVRELGRERNSHGKN